MGHFLMIVSLAVAIPFAGFAQDLSASLKQNMKLLGQLNKQMMTSVNDPASAQVNAQRAAQALALFKVVYNQAEEGVKDVPASEQAAAIEDFHNLIQQEIDFATELQSAFAANDLAKASDILLQMNDVKHEGHDKYNP